MKLSFKKKPKETGLAGVARPFQDVDIKGNGKIVGWISAPNYHQKSYEVWLRIKNEPTENSPADFQNIRLRFRGESEEATREFLKEKWDAILSHYDLRPIED